jgi:DNA ligase-1
MKKGNIMNMFNKEKAEEGKESKVKPGSVKLDTNLHESNAKRKKVVSDSDDEAIVEKSKIQSNTVKKVKIYSNSSEGDSMLFESFVSALGKIETTKGEKSKDSIKEIFAGIFKQIILNTPDDLTRAYYFLLSKVGPEYRSPELGIGQESLIKALSKAIGKSDKQIKEGIKELGDLGLVALEGKKTLGTMDKFGFGNNSKKALTLKQVIDTFIELASIKGKSSQAEKEKVLVKLMFAANKEELKFIVRSLQKSLKIGASFKTIISSIARGITKLPAYNSSSEKDIERALLISINQLSDYDIIMCNLIYEVINKKQPINNLIDLCEITPGIPLKPQLARPTTSINIIFQRFEGVPFSCEYKYDGFRGQVHHYKGKTEIFSRNLENMTESYPDLLNHFKENKFCENFILDCELVAFDKKTDKILPFNHLTTRARKNVNVEDISIHVCIFLFDIIYLDNKSLCPLTLEERRKILLETFKESQFIKFAKFINSEKFEDIDTFMQESLVAGKFKSILYNKFIRCSGGLVGYDTTFTRLGPRVRIPFRVFY